MSGKVKVKPAKKLGFQIGHGQAAVVGARQGSASLAGRKSKSSSRKGARIASVAGNAVGTSGASVKRINVLKIREGYGISRVRFHRLSGFSERALANWETGTQTPDENTTRRLIELDRLRAALSKIIQPEAIPEWLDTPNEAFGSLKPIEVAERGEADRLWRMVFELEAGMPA